MSFFAKCLLVCVLLTVLITVLFETVLYSQMPLSSNILFASFSGLMITIFYGWLDDMFFQKHQPGLEE
jgi:hypothetical protein